MAGRPPTPAFERFMSKVLKTRKCWLWQGSVLKKLPYRQFRGGAEDGFKMFKAHIFSYRLFKGVVPAGLMVCHKCDNPSCVKPAHLWLGTCKDNLRDMWRKGRGVRMIGKRNGMFGRTGQSNPNSRTNRARRGV